MQADGCLFFESQIEILVEYTTKTFCWQISLLPIEHGFDRRNMGAMLMHRTHIGYFWAAQAYMFISIPTGTSTIFGAFQDIFSLFLSLSLSLRTNIVNAITYSANMPAVVRYYHGKNLPT